MVVPYPGSLMHGFPARSNSLRVNFPLERIGFAIDRCVLQNGDGVRDPSLQPVERSDFLPRTPGF